MSFIFIQGSEGTLLFTETSEIIIPSVTIYFISHELTLGAPHVGWQNGCKQCHIELFCYFRYLKKMRE
jgi:hypothetical protein